MTDINRHIEEARALAKKIIVIDNKGLDGYIRKASIDELCKYFKK